MIMDSSQRITHTVHYQIVLFYDFSLKDVFVYDIIVLTIIIKWLINVIHLLSVRVLLVLNSFNNENRLILDTPNLLLLWQLIIVTQIDSPVLDENAGGI